MISATAKADIMTPINAWARHWPQRVNIGYWRTYIYIFYLFRLQLLVVASAKLDVKTLGSVDLSRLFLQQFMMYLYKAELMPCGYST